MTETRKIKISLAAFFKRSWPLVALGGFLVFVLAALTISIIINLHPFQNNGNNGDGDGIIVPTTAARELVPRALDGVLVPYEEAALQPFAVVVENSPDARPLAGLAKANLVIEAPVEGGVTRFLAVYDATTTADQIGPVRSARPYFVDFANGLQAVFAHVGGSPEALELIRILSSFRNLDEFSSGKYFWRSSKRPMPHNTYTRTDLLRAAYGDKDWSAAPFRPWRYSTSSEYGDVKEVAVPYQGIFSARWVFDSSTGLYARFQYGAEQKDADGNAVKAANVILLYSEAEALDEVGRLRIRTTGTGRAEAYRNGKKKEAVWRRRSGDWISFEAIDGSAMEFAPGTTWIEVVTAPAKNGKNMSS